MGRPRDFSDKTILFVLIAAVVLNFDLRRAVGAVRQMVNDRGFDLKVPHHTTVSRRMSGLTVRIMPEGEIDRDFYTAADGTGEKIRGPGQWREDKHGAQNGSKEYVMPHLLGDVKTQEILAYLLTSRYEGDGPQLPKLLAQILSGWNLKKFWGDGAYDGFKFRRLIVKQYGAIACIRIRKNGVILEKSKCPAIQARNKDLRIIQAKARMLGRSKWIAT